MTQGESYCFVIQGSGKPADKVFQYAIRPAVEECGLKCLRYDKNTYISKRVVECIHDASIIIVDIADAQADVFYQLGIAHSLMHKVIVLSCGVEKMNELGLIHGYPVIQYPDVEVENIFALKDKVIKSLKEIDEQSPEHNNPVQEFLPLEAKTKVPKTELLLMQANLSFVQQQLEQAQKVLAEDAKSKQEADELKITVKAYEKQLDDFKDLLSKLFQGTVPKGDTASMLDSMKKVISDVETKGQVEVNVKTDKTDANPNTTGKLIFKKIN